MKRPDAAKFKMDARSNILRVASPGFTLLELMVVIAIIAIFMGLAAPSFSSLITSVRVSSQTNELMADIRLARSEAAARGARVVICPSTDEGASCSASTSDWALGRIVFVDTNADGARQGTEKVLRYTSALSGNTSMVSSGFADVSITFGTYGTLLVGGNPGGSGVFKLCPSSIATGRQVSIAANGKPLSTKTVCP
jgi:type IV fimbrial biogenesis protein FimT